MLALQQTVNILNNTKEMLKGYEPNTLARELIQNADDANASLLEFRYVELVDFPEGSPWNRPAMLVSNDGMVSPEDFERLQQVIVSGKTGNPFKIGRFGVGKVALFAVSDVHLVQANTAAPGLEPSLKFAIIAALPRPEDPTESHTWDLDDRIDNAYLSKIFRDAEADPSSRLSLLVPLRRQEDGGELAGVIGWKDWSRGWFKDRSSGLQHWRAMAQVLPLTSHLKTLKVHGEGWDATWELKPDQPEPAPEDPDLQPSYRRCRRLLTPPSFQGFGTGAADPLPETAPVREFHGKIVETRDTGSWDFPYRGWESRLSHQRTIDGIYADHDTFPIAHAAVLRIGSPDAVQGHLRQVVFIGLGDMHLDGEQGLEGLILHANGECDLARTHLVNLSLTEGKSFKGQFNKRLLREGLLPLLPDALSQAEDLTACISKLLEHDWIKNGGGREAIESKKRLWRVWREGRFLWQALEPGARVLPLTLGSVLSTMKSKTISRLADQGLLVEDQGLLAAAGKANGFSRPPKLEAWEPRWLDAIGLARPERPSDAELEDWYDLLRACREGSHTFPISDRPWLQVQDGGRAVRSWVASGGFTGFKEGKEEDHEITDCIKAACPSIPWVTSTADLAFDLKPDAEANFPNLKARIAHLVDWGGPTHRIDLAVKIKDSTGVNLQDPGWRTALRTILAGATVQDERTLYFIPEPASLVPCLRQWVERTDQGKAGFALLPDAAGDESLEPARRALGMVRLSNGAILEALVNSPLLETPADYPGGRPAWGKEVLATAAEHWEPVRASDWKRLSCHGDAGDCAWGEHWRVFKEKGHNSELLRQVAGTCGIRLYERPQGLEASNRIWDSLQPIWTMKEALKHCWGVESPWAGALFDATDRLDKLIQEEAVPKETEWLRRAPDGLATPSEIRHRGQRLLESYITAKSWRPELAEDLDHWRQLPYHGAGSELAAWQPQWYIGRKDPALEGAAKALGATLFEESPFAPGSSAEPFWSLLPAWTLERALDACAQNLADAMAGPETLAQIGPLLEASGCAIGRATIDRLAGHTEWITAGKSNPEEQDRRAARILALWAQDRGAHSPALEEAWKALPLFEDGTGRGPWSERHLRSKEDPALREGARIVGRILVPAFTWPGDAWCHKNHAVHAFWNNLPELNKADPIVLECLQIGSPASLTWVAGWFDHLDSRRPCPHLAELISHAAWRTVAHREGETKTLAEHRRAGRLLGFWAAAHPTPDLAGRQAWLNFALHGQPGHLGVWPANRRIVRVTHLNDDQGTLSAAAQACGLELIRPWSLPANLRDWERYLGPYLDTLPTWTLVKALEDVLDAGIVLQVKPLLELLKGQELSREVRRRLMASAWVPVTAGGAQVAPGHVLLDGSGEWPDWLPAPVLEGWRREAEVEWPRAGRDWWLPVAERSDPQEWEADYAALVGRVRDSLPPEQRAAFTLIPQGLELDPDLLDGWLAGTPPTGGATSWDQAWRWAVWLRERHQFQPHLVQAQEADALPPEHWREGLRQLAAGTAQGEGPLTCPQDLAKSLAAAWGKADGALRPGTAFAGMRLPNASGQWIATRQLAAGAGHQDPSALLDEKFRSLLGLGDGPGFEARSGVILEGENLAAYCRDVASRTGDEAASARILLGVFLAACGPAFDGASADLLAGSFQADALREADWIETYRVPEPRPRFVEGIGQVAALAGGWLDIDPDKSWFIDVHGEACYELAPRTAGFTFLELLDGVLAILAHLEINENIITDIKERRYNPDQVDIVLLEHKIDGHVPDALKILLRFMKGDHRTKVETFLAKFENLQEQLDRANHDGQGQKATALYRKKIELIEWVKGELDQSDGHRALGEAAKSYIAKLGYSEDRVLFELFQNADDAASQWSALGLPDAFGAAEQTTFEVASGLNHLGTPIFVIKHWGRPIGRWRGLRPGPSMWRNDLVHMLRFHESGKQVEGVDRGFFGLGFKSIYLLTWEPFIFSGTAWMRVRGALWPKKMLPGEPALAQALKDFGLQSDQLPSPKNPYTCFAFRMSGQDPERRSQALLEEFWNQALPALAFSRTLKRARKAGGEVIEWRPEISTTGALKLERMTAGELRWHSYAQATVSGPERHVLFRSRNDKLEHDPKLPTLWALAPTKVFWGATALCLNGALMLDTGRTEVQGAEQHNQKEFEALGRLAQDALLHWAGDNATRKAALWHQVGKPLAEFLRTGGKTAGAPHFARALAGLWWTKPTLPIAGGSTFVAGAAVQNLLEGAADWETCPPSVLAWLQERHGVCLDLGTWEQLRRLMGFEPAGPGRLQAAQLDFPLQGGGSSPAWKLFLPTDREWASEWAKGHRLDLALLGVPDEDAKGLAWFGKIRPEAAFQRFRAGLVQDHLRRNPGDPSARKMVQSDGHLYAGLRDLERKAEGGANAGIRELVGLDARTPEPAISAFLADAGISYTRVLHQFRPSTWICAVADAWENSPDQERILGAYRSEFGSAAELLDPLPEVWRPAWFRLMVFSAAHSLGRFHSTTNQGFVGRLADVEALVQPGLDPDDPTSEANQAWLRRLYVQAQALADGGSQEGDFSFRSLYAVMHRISWQLGNFRQNLDFLRYEEDAVAARFIADPNSDVRWEGSDLSPTIPLVPVLGTVGFFVLLRELQRIGFLKTPNLRPHGFVPFGRLRRKLEITPNQGATLKDGNLIYQKVREALGDHREPTFGRTFDIPMLAAIDGRLLLN